MLLTTVTFLSLTVLSTGQIIWPQPQNVHEGTNVLVINPKDFQFVIDYPLNGSCAIITEAIERYKKITFLTKCQNIGILSDEILSLNDHDKSQQSNGTLERLTITFKTCPDWPEDGMDEEYSIKVAYEGSSEAQIIAKTIWGALRGLESFSQLVYLDESGQFLIKSTYVMDFPRFGFRGVMIDTSRHFISLRVLLQNLDAMAYNKLNVFHWHLVDDNSFPYMSNTYPDMSDKGAYSPKHVYSKEDIKRVIEYARVRGIRVIAEFDTPGHTLSWGKGQPDLLTPCYDTTTGKPNGEYGPIDPTRESSYEFVKNLFNEVTTDFHDSYVHLGGDEVEFGLECWKSNPNITKFMKEHNITTYPQLEGHYMKKLIKIIEALKKTYVVWQEVADNEIQLTASAIVHVWKDGWKEEMDNVTKNGYRVILSAPWYLNRIHYGVDWPSLYRADPFDFGGSDAQKKLVIGGVACTWSEYVDSAAIISRTWPRASAVAERLWSPQGTFESEAKTRIRHMHCLLQRRGLRVEPLDGPSFCPCDYIFSRK